MEVGSNRTHNDSMCLFSWRVVGIFIGTQFGGSVDIGNTSMDVGDQPTTSESTMTTASRDLSAAVSSSSSSSPPPCYQQYLPDWVHSDPERMAKEFEVGSKGLSDKYDDGHRFFYAYQPYLSKLVLNKLESSTVCSGGPKPRIKFMEIGLGCHFKQSGIKGGNPGGSAMGWRAIFDKLSPVLDFELHIMEYDEKCITNWNDKFPGVASMIHTGDAASDEDLARVVNETGSHHDFDVIIDDASHINWHMIKTFEVMIEQIQMGGMYFVEDLWSSCRSWGANMGVARGESTGGTRGCMVTHKKEPTFFAKMVDWQRKLLDKGVDFQNVTHIDFHGQICVIEKQLPQNENKWITRSS